MVIARQAGYKGQTDPTKETLNHRSIRAVPQKLAQSHQLFGFFVGGFTGGLLAFAATRPLYEPVIDATYRDQL